eukprot:Phypoly_transcript_18836.p1 GENE.Phypoly_transcript_18836~~Phypoly_transcript_18836.p1  ORF type:complete len:224 (+),score=-3.55 Phypoly_transcript_18836:57-728(+)
MGRFLKLVFVIWISCLLCIPFASCANDDSSYEDYSFDIECNKLDFPYITCDYNCSCHYNTNSTAFCEALPRCEGDQNFTREFNCRYCYQVPEEQHKCQLFFSCNSKSAQQYITTCVVPNSVLCLGSRQFQKIVTCNFSTGYKWSTAFLLSVFLGGFGVDRFYLGHTGWGVSFYLFVIESFSLLNQIFKLLSFGGFGIWALVDVVLIGVGYLGPADGSLYIDVN